MKISIRPAPHSKSCAIGGRQTSCGKFENNSHRCETECPDGYCCEMKHCWEMGEKLRDILIARGHEVKMANKKYRKGYPASKAHSNTKKAMAELMEWEPDVHIAIHTNASSSRSAMGVRIGYPQKQYNSVKSRIDSSHRLANHIVEENKKIYWAPKYVSSTNAYNFYELNVPKCPSIYIEGCFANSNKKDAEWWHNNMDAIAKSYADALEIWWAEENKISLNPSTKAEEKVETKEEKEVLFYAKIKPSYIWNLNLWSDNKKSKKITIIDKKEVIKILSEKDSNGYYYCSYKNKLGYVNAKYLTKV